MFPSSFFRRVQVHRGHALICAAPVGHEFASVGHRLPGAHTREGTRKEGTGRQAGENRDANIDRKASCGGPTSPNLLLFAIPSGERDRKENCARSTRLYSYVRYPEYNFTPLFPSQPLSPYQDMLHIKKYYTNRIPPARIVEMSPDEDSYGSEENFRQGGHGMRSRDADTASIRCLRSLLTPALLPRRGDTSVLDPLPLYSRYKMPRIRSLAVA